MESCISSKGQVTIPKEARDYLHVGPGDRIKFFIHPDGSVVILPKLAATALKGIVRAEMGKVSLEDMESAIAEDAAGRWRSERQ